MHLRRKCNLLFLDGMSYKYQLNLEKKKKKENERRTSLVAEWLKTPPANAGDTGSSPGPGRSHVPQSN